MESAKNKNKNKISLTLNKILFRLNIFVFLLYFSFSPMSLMVDEAAASELKAGMLIQKFSLQSTIFTDLKDNEEKNTLKYTRYLTKEHIKERRKQEAGLSAKLPENKNWKTESTTFRTITAYNSEVAQCDDSPCITANGFNVCEHGIEDTVAANFLKFGTKIRIPELFGDRIFIVRDRMNARYSDRIDIWMKSKQDAKHFGKRTALVEVIE